MGAFLVLFPLSMANVATNGAIQLAVDAANYQLVRFISALPKGSAVSVNMPNPNAYVYQIGVLCLCGSAPLQYVGDEIGSAATEDLGGTLAHRLASVGSPESAWWTPVSRARGKALDVCAAGATWHGPCRSASAKDAFRVSTTAAQAHGSPGLRKR